MQSLDNRIRRFDREKSSELERIESEAAPIREEVARLREELAGIITNGRESEFEAGWPERLQGEIRRRSEQIEALDRRREEIESRPADPIVRDFLADEFREASREETRLREKRKRVALAVERGEAGTGDLERVEGDLLQADRRRGAVEAAMQEAPGEAARAYSEVR